MRWNIVAKISWFAGCARLHQLIQLADLGLQQVDLLLLAKHRAIKYFQVIFAKTKLDFEFCDPGFHLDSPVIE